MPHRLSSFALAVVAVLYASDQTEAHALRVVCRLEADKIVVEAFYDDNTPARKSTVRVENAEGRSIDTGEGQTDAEGRWSFARPKPGRYRVVVNAGAGHLVKEWIDIPAENGNGRQVSGGPSREEATRFPWLKVLLGFGAIAGFSLALWLARKFTSRDAADHTS